MPNVDEVNQELVRAFNIDLRFNGIAVTNLTVRNSYGKDHIVISFDNNMSPKQCMGYLNNLKEKVIRKSYKNEKAAKVSYDLKSFPFDFNKGRLEKGNKGERFLVEIDEGVVFNLKCYLAQALVGNITEKMGSKFGAGHIKRRIYDTSFDKDSYLLCIRFDDRGLQKYFIDSFLKDIGEYENSPVGYLEANKDLVYIKKRIFDDVKFIKSIAEYNASLECRYLRTPSIENRAVDKLKYTMVDFMDRAAGIPVRTIIRTSYVDSKENSVLVPLVQSGKFLNFFTESAANKLNHVFDGTVVTEIESSFLKNPYWDGNEVYAIDLSDWDVSYCVLNKIIENSVINEKHELSIDPELFERAVSRTSSLEEQPPLSGMSQVGVSPTCSQKEQIKESPRQVSEGPAGTEGRLYHTIDQSQQSMSTAVVDVDESMQGACGGPFSPKSRMQVYHGQALASLASGESDIESSGEHFKAESKENRAKSESPKKHSGGPRCSVKKSSSSETFLEKLASSFRRKDKKRHSMVSSFSAPGSVAIEKLPSPPWNSLPSRKSNPLLKEGSPAHSPSDDDAPVLLNKPNPNKVDLFQLPSDDSGIASASTSSSGDKLHNSMLSINSDIGLISSSKLDPLIHKRKYTTFPLQNREYPRSLEPLSEMDATETESFPGGAANRRSGRFSHADKITQQRQEDEGVGMTSHS